MKSRPAWDGADACLPMKFYGITPDIMTLAKALANGIPIGAMLATADAATGFDYGSHATTFGGTPLAAAQPSEVFSIISRPEFLEQECDGKGPTLKNS